MNFEKIEQAYEIILENSQLIQNQLNTHIYDAIIEQNSYFLGAKTDNKTINKNNDILKTLALTSEEWRRVFQFIFIKAGQTEKLQANHQFTPDTIGFLFVFLIDSLTKGKESLDIIEIGSGTGNLAQTILNYSQNNLNYLGIEIDDLLIDLSASIAEIMSSSTQFIQGDAVRPHILKESDFIIADLPIGYYPNDEIAARYEVASSKEHTYAHHLLMEQSLKYLKKDGFAIMLAPTDLLASQQSDLLKSWLKGYASIQAVIALPENLFGNSHMTKSIYILQKQQKSLKETFVFPLSDITNPESLNYFMESFRKWNRE